VYDIEDKQLQQLHVVCQLNGFLLLDKYAYKDRKSYRFDFFIFQQTKFRIS
jgi:hypothetical protein